MNKEYNNWAWFQLITEFAYNNSKIDSTDHILFKLNCGYHLWVFFEDEYNVHSRFSLANELATELKKPINIYCQNFLHAQDLWKQEHNKRIKPQSYALRE